VIDGHAFSRLSEAERVACLAEAAAAGVNIAVGNLTMGQQAQLAGTTPPTLRNARRAAGAPIRGYKKSKRPKPATPYVESSLDGILRALRAMGSKTLLDIAANVEREELAVRSAAAAAQANGNSTVRNGSGAAHP
jgi:hypothetical protein